MARAARAREELGVDRVLIRRDGEEVLLELLGVGRVRLSDVHAVNVGAALIRAARPNAVGRRRRRPDLAEALEA